MAGRVTNFRPIAPKGERRKRFIPTAEGQRAPRIRDKDHLGFIAQLPCVITGVRPVEVCHLRYAEVSTGKPATGMQEKPSDRWTLPLSAEMHRLADDSQHAGSEREFWERHGINPIGLATALFNVSGNVDKALFIIENAALLFPVRKI